MPTMPSDKQAMAKSQELGILADKSHSSGEYSFPGRFVELSAARGIQMYIFIYVYIYIFIYVTSISVFD